MPPLKLEIYSDYICPWCYVEQGVVEKLITEHQAEVECHPYFLRPDMPPEGMDLPEHVKARMAETNNRLKQKADAFGLKMVFATHIPNTRLAHEATEYAHQKGKQLEFHHAVFDKFYAKGEDISQWGVLRDAALQVGLDADEMQREVEGGCYTETVNAQVRKAQEFGITGVPTYILNDRHEIFGAQPYEVFLQVLEQIKKEESEPDRLLSKGVSDGTKSN
jgi:predicted DsbA family dithiol-disulfide isomerase